MAQIRYIKSHVGQCRQRCGVHGNVYSECDPKVAMNSEYGPNSANQICATFLPKVSHSTKANQGVNQMWSTYVSANVAQGILKCMTTAKMHHSMQHVGHMRNVGKTRVWIKINCGPHYGQFWFIGWLTCSNAKAYLRHKSGKQEWTAQMPLFHIICGLEQGVWSGPELK